MGKNIGIILAGGIGSRFGADKPKQYCTVFGKDNSDILSHIILLIYKQRSLRVSCR